MILAVPMLTDQLGGVIANRFEDAAYFTLEGSKTKVIPVEHKGGKDIARLIIASDVTTLITSHVELEAFVLLKSYGVSVYAAQGYNVSDALRHFQEGTLHEVTAENYLSVFGSSKPILAVSDSISVSGSHLSA